MSGISGPCRSIPGGISTPPDNMMCDNHEDVHATKRVQGETDSFGAEYSDYCDECFSTYKAEMDKSKEIVGKCDWCHTSATTTPTRDYDEGACGPVYEVCNSCIRKANDEAARELEGTEDYYEDYY